jgi:hypothetical protein
MRHALLKLTDCAAARAAWRGTGATRIGLVWPDFPEMNFHIDSSYMRNRLFSPLLGNSSRLFPAAERKRSEVNFN